MDGTATRTELSTQLGINKSRTYRMLCTLVLHDFVVQDERTLTYALGPQTFVPGVAAARQNTLVRSAHRHMLALNCAISETVILRVHEGLETVCVALCETTHHMRAVGSVGNRRSIRLGASGKVLLAFAPEAVKNEFFERLKQLHEASEALTMAEELDSLPLFEKIRPTSRSKANGNTYTVPSTRLATRSISCYVPGVTRPQHAATFRDHIR